MHSVVSIRFIKSYRPSVHSDWLHRYPVCVVMVIGKSRMGGTPGRRPAGPSRGPTGQDSLCNTPLEQRYPENLEKSKRPHVDGPGPGNRHDPLEEAVGGGLRRHLRWGAARSEPDPVAWIEHMEMGLP